MRIATIFFFLFYQLRCFSQESGLECIDLKDTIATNARFNSKLNCILFWGGKSIMSIRPFKVKYLDQNLEVPIDSSSLAFYGWLNDREIIFRKYLNNSNDSFRIRLLVKDVLSREERFINSINPDLIGRVKIFDNSIIFSEKKNQGVWRWDDLTKKSVYYPAVQSKQTSDHVYFRQRDLLLYISKSGSTYRLMGLTSNNDQPKLFDQSNSKIMNIVIDTTGHKVYYVKRASIHMGYLDEVWQLNMHSGILKLILRQPFNHNVEDIDIFSSGLLLSINDYSVEGETTIRPSGLHLKVGARTSICVLERLN